ncbi:hypothetical protein ACFLSU_06190 [Bacteroidota bacterium]
MQIHATNINGLGASQVVISFLDAYASRNSAKNTTIYLPSTGVLSNYIPTQGIVKRFYRKSPNAVSHNVIL